MALLCAVFRASLHLRDLVKCLWAAEITVQIDTTDLQSPGGRSVDSSYRDMYVLFFYFVMHSSIKCLNLEQSATQRSEALNSIADVANYQL